MRTTLKLYRIDKMYLNNYAPNHHGFQTVRLLPASSLTDILNRT